MKNSVFRRHFLLTAGMILISFSLLSAAFMTLSYRYMVQEKKQSMTQNTAYTVALLQNILDQRPEEDFFPLYSPALSAISDCDILICTTDGTVLRYTANDAREEEDPEQYIGLSISASIGEQLSTEGSYAGMTDLGLYSELHFVSGSTLTLSAGESSTTYLVFMSTSAGELLSLWKALATLFFFVAVVVLCIAFVSSSVFSLQQVRPLRDMSDAVRRFGMGDYDVRVADTDRKDEIGELAVAFNSMAETLANSEQLRQELLANLSHELKTPLTTIGGFTDGVLDGTIPPERAREALLTVSAESARLGRMVRRMLDAGVRRGEGSVQSHTIFDVCESMIQAVISLEGKIRSHRLDMDLHLPDSGLKVWGDSDAIGQVCYNLLDNAAKFAAPGTVITVNITAKGGKAYISVKNLGETIPPEELNVIFDRFHKSDRSRSIDREGVGLGLYIVRSILNEHKETITVRSAEGVTEFVFTMTLAA